jgi:hypothetical protein
MSIYIVRIVSDYGKGIRGSDPIEAESPVHQPVHAIEPSQESGRLVKIRISPANLVLGAQKLLPLFLGFILAIVF